MEYFVTYDIDGSTSPSGKKGQTCASFDEIVNIAIAARDEGRELPVLKIETVEHEPREVDLALLDEAIAARDDA